MIICFPTCWHITMAGAGFRVFLKVDHSANVDRTILVEYTIGSVVELEIYTFVKDITRFW